MSKLTRPQLISAEKAAERAKIELTAESSLADITITFFRHWLRFDFNIVVTIGSCLFFFFATWHMRENELQGAIRSVVDTFISFSVTSFGFLVAGISLVATITKRDFYTKLSKCVRAEYGMSELKVVLILLFYTLAAFVFYIFVLFIFKVVPLDFAYKVCPEVRMFPVDIESYYRVLYCALSAYAVYLCLLLKSLAWNLYVVYTDVILIDLLPND